MSQQTEIEVSRVKIGSRVTVKLDGDSFRSFVITPACGGDPDHGMVSCDAPLAKAVLGRRTGEAARYAVGDRIHEARIVKIA